MLSWLERFLRLVSAAALLVLFALIVVQVVMRYGFRYTPFFTEEIGRYALVWSVLAGAAVAVHRDEHIRVTLLREWLGERSYRAIGLVLDLVSLVILAVLAWSAVQSVQFVAGQTSSGLQVPLSYPYLALPAAFGAAVIFCAARLWNRLRPGRGPGT